jgi:hypothetical protein
MTGLMTGNPNTAFNLTGRTTAVRALNSLFSNSILYINYMSSPGLRSLKIALTMSRIFHYRHALFHQNQSSGDFVTLAYMGMNNRPHGQETDAG